MSLQFAVGILEGVFVPFFGFMYIHDLKLTTCHDSIISGIDLNDQRHRSGFGVYYPGHDEKLGKP